MDDVLALIRRHRSIRRYADAPVPDPDVRTAVEAGQAASTSSAIQAYCLIRIRDARTRGRLVELTGGQAKVAEAGAFFVVAGDTRRHRLAAGRAGAPYDTRLEAFLLAVVDATLFAQNVALAFEAMGYGICYVGGLRNRLPEVDRLLEIPEGVYPLYGLCVGRPDEDPLPRPRLPLEAVLLEERYPSDEEALGHLDRHDAEVAAYLRRRGKEAPAWAQRMADTFAAPRRPDIGPYYAAKGADLR